MSINSLKKKVPMKMKSRAGAGFVLTVLGAAIAAAIIVVPLARWQMSLSENVASVNNSLDNASVKLEMMSALEDRWRQINDMNIDAFKAATNNTTKYGKYTVSESYGTLGIYNESTGNCDSGTPSNDDKACRVATLTVKGPEGVPDLGPITATRVASAKWELKGDYIINAWRNGTEWYRVYKSGYVEQGGYVRWTTADYQRTGSWLYNVKLHIPYKTNQYTITISPESIHNSGHQQLCGYGIVSPGTVAPQSFSMLVCYAHYVGYYWTASGIAYDPQ